MVGTSSTSLSNNLIMNCNCTRNVQNGMLLNKFAGITIQECLCTYNLTGSYNNNSQTVQNIALVGSGITMTNAQYNIIDGCVCSYNVSNCFSNNNGTSGTGSVGGSSAVMNCTFTGGGIYLVASSNNVIKNCLCDNNVTSMMCSNTGGASTSDGGGAGVGGAGAVSTSAGQAGICSVAGAGIFLDGASANNNIENCECDNNNTGQFCYNFGGQGASGGGSGVAVAAAAKIIPEDREQSRQMAVGSL